MNQPNLLSGQALFDQLEETVDFPTIGSIDPEEAIYLADEDVYAFDSVAVIELDNQN